ncbi:MAG TPA: hypothetical protein DD670_11350 [Planctomycetaceae bacterium]|nr:hypothetical protein [Planctomycetaceae bacterium]
MKSCIIGWVLAFVSLLVGSVGSASASSETPPRLNVLKLPIADASLVTIRAVTRGPKFHWFGYYDKLQGDTTGRYLLAMEVDFEHRPPRPDDVVRIGMIDLADGDRWIELAESRAWSWQQGCALQWRPGSETEILFNDREGDRFVCRVFDVKTRKLVRTLPMAIEYVTPDGKKAVCSDYRRIQYIRRDYGYAGLPDPNLNVMAPDDVGAWSMDMETGETKLLVSVERVAKIPYPGASPEDKHYLSHFTWNPDGTRFLMFNRWGTGEGWRGTRVFTSDGVDGGDLRLLSARGASHWTWRDPDHAVISALGGFNVYKDDGSGMPKETLWIAPDGHATYIPGTNHQWLVCDTYPTGPQREQTLYLIHLPTGRAVVLGRFHSPKVYSGEWRCDLHPRVSRDGKYVVIDATHGGNGRQQYLIDISRVTAGEAFPSQAAASPSHGEENPKASSPQASTQSTVPRDRQELRSRMEEIRRQYAPYLRSLPRPLSVRSRTSLESAWRTKFEIEQAKDANRPDPPDWHREDLDDSSWKETTVPEWRYRGDAYRHPVSCILWYRTRFSATEAKTRPKDEGGEAPGSQRRTFLVFGGVDWEAEVWLNGKRLGSHVTYQEPFRFDVTGLLKDENTLAVRVASGPLFGEPRAYNAIFPMPPAKQQRYVRDKSLSIVGFKNDDLFLGAGFGIHREVYLETTGKTCLDEILVRANLEKQQATVTFQTDAATAGRLAFDVNVLPENFEGRAYRAHAIREVPRGQAKQTFVVSMPNAEIWRPEAPCLYRCRVTCRADEPLASADAVSDGARVIDAEDAIFGCRSFEMVSKQHPRDGLPEGLFLLNGRPLYVRGTNIQGFNALWYWNEMDRLTDVILMLKAAHFNVVRACQHVCFPEIRELFDRYGVMSEQDQGCGRDPLNERSLPHAGTVLARECYNNPGVVLLSLANETKFDPTKAVEAVLAVDPERILVPISGNLYPGRWPQYPIPDALWANVIQDVHGYPGWYARQGELWTFGWIRQPARFALVGEYGAEALDSYETMANHYPSHWRRTPPADADTLWAHVQVEKSDVRQFVGLRGRRPVNLGQYIEASQNYQVEVVAETSKGLRFSPRAIGGYFQFHFFDVVPANWPKSIVSHDLTPKKAYYTMAQVNQPLVPLFQLIDRGNTMELWVANDLPESREGCHLQWNVVAEERTLLGGERTVDAPAANAVVVGRVDLAAITASTEVVTIRLKLSDANGALLATYEQEVFLRLWRERDELLKTAKSQVGEAE